MTQVIMRPAPRETRMVRKMVSTKYCGEALGTSPQSSCDLRVGTLTILRPSTTTHHPTGTSTVGSGVQRIRNAWPFSRRAGPQKLSKADFFAEHVKCRPGQSTSGEDLSLRSLHPFYLLHALCFLPMVLAYNFSRTWFRRPWARLSLSSTLDLFLLANHFDPLPIRNGGSSQIVFPIPSHWVHLQLAYYSGQCAAKRVAWDPAEQRTCARDIKRIVVVG